MLNLKEFKMGFKETMKNFVPFLAAYLIMFLMIVIALGFINIGIVISMCAVLALTLISAGFTNMFIKAAKGEEAKVSHLFELLKADKIVKTIGVIFGFLIFSIMTAMVSEGTIYIVETVQAQFDRLFCCSWMPLPTLMFIACLAFLMFLVEILCYYVVLRLSLVIPLYCLNPNLKVKEYFKLSYKYMKGKILTYLAFLICYGLLPFFALAIIGTIMASLLFVDVFSFIILSFVLVAGLLFAVPFYTLFIYELLEVKQLLKFIPEEFYDLGKEEKCDCCECEEEHKEESCDCGCECHSEEEKKEETSVIDEIKEEEQEIIEKVEAEIIE